MTCNHCCGANQLFDLKSARKKLKSYLKKGPNRVTKHLISAIQLKRNSKNNSFNSLLDIGGGICAIGIELNKSQSKTLNTTLVDASSGFVQVATELYLEQTNSSITTHTADFLDVCNQVGPHDIVVLDKVICCYPDAQRLIMESTDKSHRFYGLTFPWGGPFGRFFAKVANLVLKLLFNNDFRTYIHDPESVFKLVEKQGFKRIYHKRTFPWHIVLYERDQILNSKS